MSSKEVDLLDKELIHNSLNKLVQLTLTQCINYYIISFLVCLTSAPKTQLAFPIFFIDLSMVNRKY